VSVIVPAAAVTIASTVAASVMPKQYGGQGKAPSPRLLIGTGLTFTGLSFLEDYAPSIITPLAAAIAITALTYYGVPVLDAYFNGKHPGATSGQSRAITVNGDPNTYTVTTN
jgi:hypothetical protein